jgi:hypothetical protein
LFLDSSEQAYYSFNQMTAYRHITSTPLPSFAVQEAKAKRRQVLTQAAQIRRANYLRFLKKRRLLASKDLL